MAFRQPIPAPSSRRYSDSQQQTLDDGLATAARVRTSHFDSHLGPISDFGSLNTIAQSGDEELSDIIEDVVDDLDSLDEGLQAFQDPSLLRVVDSPNAGILPVHDGLGSFHQKTPLSEGTGFNVQPFYGLDNIHTREQEEDALESSRYERVERWRLEQSKVLLEEIEKERQRVETKGTSRQSRRPVPASPPKQSERVEIHEDESIWQRFAEHVMREVIGVDDAVLSAIFGEDLVSEELSKTPTPSIPVPQVPGSMPAANDGFLSKLIQELRQLAQGLSTQTPTDQSGEPLDYAGMPLSWLEDRNRTNSVLLDPLKSTQFQPTIHNLPAQTDGQAKELVAESDYWEQTPKLKTVISYLYQRFRSSSSTPRQQQEVPISTTPRTPDALHRAAIIRQNHPLTARHKHLNHARSKRHHQHTGKASGSSHGIPHYTTLKRPGSSCASWSTKRSRFNGSDAGSRNYWDLGESSGSGSLMFTSVGAWGEV